MLAHASATGSIIKTRAITRPTKRVVSFWEATKLSPTSNVYYIKKYDGNLKVFHATETEKEQEMV